MTKTTLLGGACHCQLVALSCLWLEEAGPQLAHQCVWQVIRGMLSDWNLARVYKLLHAPQQAALSHLPALALKKDHDHPTTEGQMSWGDPKQFGLKQFDPDLENQGFSGV